MWAKSQLYSDTGRCWADRQTQRLYSQPVNPMGCPEWLISLPESPTAHRAAAHQRQNWYKAMEMGYSELGISHISLTRQSTRH